MGFQRDFGSSSGAYRWHDEQVGFTTNKDSQFFVLNLLSFLIRQKSSNCGGGLVDNICSAIAEGLASEADLDARVTR